MPCQTISASWKTAQIILVASAILVANAWAQGTYRLLYSFAGGNDGAYPSELAVDQAGNLYGATGSGGANNAGAIFKLTRSNGVWSKAVLYDFTGGADGRVPSRVSFDLAGNLYGTTAGGGANGLGTVFRLHPNPDGSWTEAVLYSFASGADARQAGSGVTVDKAGRLYGTTYSGGVNGYGAVFEMKFSGGVWKERVIHSFSLPDGAHPTTRLTLGPAGSLYGTTVMGGTEGVGTVFNLTRSNGNWSYAVLYNFRQDGSGGRYPWGSNLALDKAGNLYGTTPEGGINPDGGTVFKLAPANGSWTESVIYNFCAVNCSDGVEPLAGVILDGANNLYGTTYTGGGLFCGTVFKLTPNPDGSWNESVLYNFQGGADGVGPSAGLTFDGQGNLFGSTRFLGAYNSGYGTVFEVKP
jgi:uncharacterized repeat protein (TIGR03803 family)